MNPESPSKRKTTTSGAVSSSNDGPRQLSRTSSNEGNRTGRQFWWSPKRNNVEIHNENVALNNVKSKVNSFSNINHRPGGGQVVVPQGSIKWQTTSRIDSLSNMNWTPPSRNIVIPQEKTKWRAQPKVGSMANIKHKPVNANVEIYNEKLDFTHITPRVDCGFS